MSRIAMISPNIFVSIAGNGWRGSEPNRVFLSQNTSFTDLCGVRGNMIWGELKAISPTFEKLFFYVDNSNQLEQLIEVLLHHGFWPVSIVFVTNNMMLGYKRKLIIDKGFAESRMIGSEVGGAITMWRIYQSALLGQLPG